MNWDPEVIGMAYFFDCGPTTIPPPREEFGLHPEDLSNPQVIGGRGAYRHLITLRRKGMMPDYYFIVDIVEVVENF